MQTGIAICKKTRVAVSVANISVLSQLHESNIIEAIF